ncbi:MAG: ArsA family ATPase [Candidatus Dormibacteraeota bacterium]|jgi:arsenite-transporting ATPase|nr:ArsA family ATPase [Candidatus Dormibacteraeota bacterium]
MRVILYTGKGGVGKTTIAAATAVRCAKRGLKTLVISTDAAHSLGDSLDCEIGPEPIQVGENLFAQEVNALHEMEGHWEKIHEYLASLFNSQGVDDIIAEELATPPGMEEVASLMWIRRHSEQGLFDVLVVDCAPTGETLQLLAFPDVARWYLNKIFPIERRVMKMARPMVQPFIGVPLPSDEIYGSVRQLLVDLDSMKEVLSDPKTCTVRLVLNLEKMVIKEAQRAFTYLNLYDYQVDAVLVNRVLPKEVGEGYFSDWRRVQAKYSEQVDEAFSPVPILQSRLFDHEIVGVEHLDELGGSLFGDTPPEDILYRAKSQTLRKTGDEYLLTMQIPFVSREEVELTQKDDELYISVGPYKREISLPRVLRGKETRSARLEDGKLMILFGRAS